MRQTSPVERKVGLARRLAIAAGAVPLTLAILLSTPTRAAAEVTIRAHELEGPNTDIASVSSVHAVHEKAGNRDLVTIDEAAAPRKGEAFVLPPSDFAPEGVLGIVTKIFPDSEPEEVQVETKPASLDEAFSQVKFDIEGRRLSELDAEVSSSSVFNQFKCDGSAKFKEPKLASALTGLKPDVHFNLRKKTFLLALDGEPKATVKTSVHGEGSCEYDGDLKVNIPIHGPTPIFLTFWPAAHADLSGDFKASLSWAPKVRIGMERESSGTSLIAEMKPRRPQPPKIEGEGEAGIFLGVRVGLTVAGRAGLRGTIGPRIDAELSSKGGSPCVSANASVYSALEAFLNVWVHKWKHRIAAGKAARTPIWENEACKKPPEPGFERGD